MGKALTQENVSGVAAPPPGYPTENLTVTVEKKKKGWFRLFRSNKSKGDGCAEGCLAGLCCCFVCEECC
ncbi:hypothetical protein Droror1_Dr00015365 [Drosera rotundifolia]